MRKLAVAVITVIAAVTLSATAAAPTHRVPGQWEVTSSMKFTKGGIQIPPEVQQQMAASGMKLPMMGQPMTFKTCLTPEQAARDEQPQVNNDKSCTNTNMQWTGNSYHAEFTCTKKGSPIHGTVEGTAASDGKSYTGTFRMQGHDAELGGDYVMEGQGSGKWLGPTCPKRGK